MPNEVLIRRLATVAALLCVVAVVVTAGAVAFPSLRAKLGLNPVTPPSYKVGERIDVPADLYDASSVTVLAFVRGNCPSCQRAQPMFKDLADRLSDTPARLRLVVNTRRAADDAEYAAPLGSAASLVTVDFSSLRLRAVPTLVVVNRRGDVLYALEGPPSDQQRDDILRLVRANLHSS